MTLIELLLAMGMAALLAVVVFSVYSSVLNTIRAQTLWRNTMSPAVAALHVLDRDLTCSLIPSGLSNAPFILDSRTHEGTTTQLFFTTAYSAFLDNLRNYEIYQVRYALRSAGVTGKYSLIRQCWPFRVPQADARVTEEELVKNVTQFQMQVFNGDQWTNQWGMKDADGLPLAARVKIVVRHDVGFRTTHSEVLIPAGHRISEQTSN